MRHLLLIAAVALAATPSAQCQRKKPMPKAGPKVLMALPLGVPAGAKTRLTLRGLVLDGATEVTCSPKGEVKIVKKGKVAVPPKLEANAVGDCEVEVELTVPADAGDEVTLTVKTPAGETPAYAVLVDKTPVVAEKEPNEGFRQAQPVALGQVIQGTVGRPLDVDVYAFEGKAGQKVVVEVLAARRGSALDAFLTLYDAKGNVVASDDDGAGGADARVEATLAKAGTYYVAVIDAHDQGGPAHVYRLLLAEKK